VAGVRPERLDEARRLAGGAVDITAPATAADFDLAIHTAAPVTATVLDHVRNGGKVASIVRLPELEPAPRDAVGKAPDKRLRWPARRSRLRRGHCAPVAFRL
jgi:hypothetical protein